MSTVDQIEDSSETNDILIPAKSKRGFILSRIDLVALVITVLGIFLLGMAALVLAVIYLAKWISHFWHTPSTAG